MRGKKCAIASMGSWQCHECTEQYSSSPATQSARFSVQQKRIETSSLISASLSSSLLFSSSSLLSSFCCLLVCLLVVGVVGDRNQLGPPGSHGFAAGLEPAAAFLGPFTLTFAVGGTLKFGHVSLPPLLVRADVLKRTSEAARVLALFDVHINQQMPMHYSGMRSTMHIMAALCHRFGIPTGRR